MITSDKGRFLVYFNQPTIPSNSVTSPTTMGYGSSGGVSRVGLRNVYKISFFLFVCCTVFTLVSLTDPSWFRSRVRVGDIEVSTTYGLAEKCSSIDGSCSPFPENSDCQLHGESFCTTWKTAGFSSWLALLFQACSICAYICAFHPGNEFTFESAWKVLSCLIFVSSFLQAISTIAMAVLLETSGLFVSGNWRIGRSWAFATTSWTLSLMLILALIIVGVMTPNEYEEFYDTDFESVTTNDDEDENHDDFYYFNRQQRRNFLNGQTSG